MSESTSNKGTDGDAEGASSGTYFLIREAECSDDSSDGGSAEQGESEGEDETSAFIDNTDVDQGDSASLFAQQQREDSDLQTQVLKRKFIQSTPERPVARDANLELSPILKACSITPKKVKKRIRFADQENEAGGNAPAPAVEPEVDGTGEDSGVVDVTPGTSSTAEGTAEASGESAEGSAEGSTETDSEALLRDAVDTQQSTETDSVKIRKEFNQVDFVKTLLRSQNVRAKVLFNAKDGFGVSMSELCRIFKSNKTCSTDWVVAIVGVREDVVTTSHEQLQQHCDCVYTRVSFSGNTPVALQLLSFKHQKNRDTLHKLLKQHMMVDEQQIISNPPRTGSTAAALYWYKGTASSAVMVHGQLPPWVLRQCEVAHKMAGETTFELSQMVQWAYDHDLCDESSIALGYALIADEEENAQAFLRSNSQLKFVRDCAHMVRLYKRGEMLSMSMGEWIQYRASKVTGDRPDGWKNVLRFLRMQQVEIIPFLITMKYFLKGVPKKNCIAIDGPPDTGKSLFAMSLVKYLGGKVITFVNSKSQFWLQPLSEAKIGLIDDCTLPFWTYCDTYLRNGLDGNVVCIDCKHKAPIQLKFPPMIITTNVSIANDPKWTYLTNRIKSITFPTVLRKVEGTPLQLQDEDWKSFFDHFKVHLELDIEEDGEDGQSHGTLRVSSRKDL